MRRGEEVASILFSQAADHLVASDRTVSIPKPTQQSDWQCESAVMVGNRACGHVIRARSRCINGVSSAP
jgi:2-keto-4-pentenoate hydratase/2-oxohepta-3-ene-1,7-dioic acid hydratase in catechol pathway